MRSVVLIRGINLGAIKRVPMPVLCQALAESGLRDVRSYMQSGNLVADAHTAGGDEEFARLVEELIAQRFGVSVPVLVRSAAELRAVIDLNPFPDPAGGHPKEYQVSFLSGPLVGEEAIERLDAHRAAGEIVAVSATRREVYAWYQGGIHRSKLTAAVSDRKLGVTATARNWTTVTTLMEMVGSDAD